MNEKQAELLAEVPTSGTVAYDNVRRLLLSKGKESVIREFHTMRRAKQLHAWTDENGILLVSRSPRPEA